VLPIHNYTVTIRKKGEKKADDINDTGRVYKIHIRR